MLGLLAVVVRLPPVGPMPLFWLRPAAARGREELLLGRTMVMLLAVWSWSCP